MTTVFSRWALTPEGLLQDVTIRFNGTVRSVTVGAPPPDDALRLDHHLLLPGMVNAHSHAFQRAFRGHVQWRGPGRDDFWSWREAMYATARQLDPDGVFAVSQLAFLEMAEAGITHVGEFHYLHHGVGGVRYADPDELARQVIRAARSVGLSITLLRVLYGRNGQDAPLGEHQLRFGDAGPDDALRAVARLRGVDDPGLNIGLAPHSVRAVPASWLAELASFDGVVHAHVAEQPAELASCRAEYGVDPLEVFECAGLLHDRFTAVHLTHPASGDAARLRNSGASVAVCPTTELDLGDGFLPIEVREGIHLCVGSDSHASIDPWLELRSLEMHARGLANRRNVMSPPDDRHGLARRLLAIGSAGGSRALGVREARIEVGAPAAFVALDLDRPAAAGVPPLEAAALVATPEWVSHSWNLGRPVVVDGAHPLRREVLERARPYLGASSSAPE